MSDLLQAILELSECMGAAQKTLLSYEKKVEDLKQEIMHLSEKLIPDAMLSIGLTEVRLQDGTKVTVKPNVKGSVSKDRMDAVAEWLEANNAGAIMKQSLSVDMDKKEQLIAAGLSFSTIRSIHHSTLQAFIREQVESNNPNFPRELFGVFEGSKAVMKTG